MLEALSAAVLVAFGGIGLSHLIELSPLRRVQRKPFSCEPCRVVLGCGAAGTTLCLSGGVSLVFAVLVTIAGIGGAAWLLGSEEEVDHVR